MNQVFRVLSLVIMAAYNIYIFSITCVSHLQMLSPWVGLRKINVSYWGWEDASPFTNNSLQWLPGEPSDSGFCAYLERTQVAGLKANPCTATTDGLICEKPAGEKESWRKVLFNSDKNCFTSGSCKCMMQLMKLNSGRWTTTWINEP